MWMDCFLDARPPGRLLARIPDDLVGHRPLGVIVPAPAGKEPGTRFVLQAAPVLAERFEEFGTEHDIAVLATLAAENVDHHAVGVDVGDLEAGQTRSPQAGRLKWHPNGTL